MNHFIRIRSCICQYLLFLAISLVYFFVASPYTSPSNPYYNCDSSIFYTIGNGINAGLVPYKDLFDHKGPLLFFIYSWGTAIVPGKTGVFFLQSLCGAFSLLFLFKLSRLFLNIKWSVAIIGVLLFIMPASIGEGALSEEWSLPFAILPLYYLSKAIIENKEPSLRYWFSIGACFMLLAMIRLNNAPVVIAICVYLTFSFLYQQKFKYLFKSHLSFLAGMTVALLPFLIYFIQKDAMQEFIEGNFLHNFQRAAYGASTKTCDFWIIFFGKTLAVVALLLIGYINVKNKKIKPSIYILYSLAGLISTIALIPGSGFPHYYMTFLPTICLALIQICVWASTLQRIKAFICTCCSVIAVVLFYINASISQILCGGICICFPGHPTEKRLQLECIEKFKQIIPNEETSSLLVLDTWPYAYLYMNISPSFKYFTLQNIHAEIQPEISNALYGLFTGNNAPKWIILTYHPEGISKELQITHPGIKDIISSNYERVSYGEVRMNGKDRNFSLYRRSN